MRHYEPFSERAWMKPNLGSGLEEAGIGKHLGKPPLMRPKLLQPLPQAERPDLPVIDEGVVRFRCGYESPSPGLRPPRTEHSSPEEAVVEQSRPSRPGSAVRPRIGTWISPPLDDVNFSAALQLRRPGEEAVIGNLWAKPKEVFVLPLQTQTIVRRLAADCSSDRREICEGSVLTAWIISPEEGDGSSPVLEPLAACCPDQTLAVQPVHLIIERGSGPEARSPGAPVRFGEAFRLRDTASGFYLSHGDDSSTLRWVRLASGDDPATHPGLRFAAHGGELGAPLLLGRPLVIQRVSSPAPAPSDDSDSSDYDSTDSDSDMEYATRSRKAKPQPRRNVPAAKSSSRDSAASSLVVDCGALLCRHADAAPTFSASFLPVSQQECISEQGSSKRSTSGSDEEDVRAMDSILNELKTQLDQEASVEMEQLAALEQTARRKAELERQIDAGDKLRRVAKDARASRKSQDCAKRIENI